MELNRVRRVLDRIPVRSALISVADKDGLEPFVAGLWRIVPDLMIYSTGGTYTRVADMAAELGRSQQLRAIQDYTGQPEMQGGLVKTLDFRIYLGLLGETFNEAHQSDIRRTGAVPFDLTVCNFYPFAAASASPDATVEDLRTHVDIGGPTMLRASAKNFPRVAALHAPSQYGAFLTHLERNDGASRLATRASLAAAAFRYTADYEATIAANLSRRLDAADALGVYTPQAQP